MLVSRKVMFMLSAAALALPVAAFGQERSAEASAQAAAPDAASDESGLTEIVVTAQQRNENLQKAAVPISVVTGTDISNSGTRGIDTLGKLVPALVVTPSSQGNLVFIRGVGNFSFTPNSDPATAYNLDGVYVGRSSSTYGTFFDLDRIEVLKGPQGTLYGRNATAGAINILPAQPRLGETSGYGSFSYGNYNAVAAEGAINLGLGDNAAFRLSGTYANHDGYLRDGTADDDQAGIRAQLKVKLTPELTVRIAADYSQLRGFGSGTSYTGKFAFNPGLGQFVVTPSGLSLGEGLFTPAAQQYRTTNGFAGSLAGRALDPLTVKPFVRNDSYGIAYHVDWETPIGTVSVIPAWRHAKKSNISTDSAQSIGTTQDADQYSVEARLVSNRRGVLDYIFGAYYFSEQLDDDLHLAAGVQAQFTKSRYTTRSPAFYGRLTLHATDWLRVTGGVRYTEDHKKFTSQGTTLVLVCPSAVPAVCSTAPLFPYTTTLDAQPFVPALGGPPLVRAPGVLIARIEAPTQGKLDTNKVTYRAAIEADLGPRSLLFASVETGYRAGGFNSTFNFGPESITAFTVGSKNRFLDNRLQLNAELFYWKYKGQQLSYLGIDPLGGIGILTQNVGRSTIKGAEVEARALVTPTTTLTANVQYLDATYDSFTYSTPARPFSGCAVTQTTLFNVDCSGKPGINAPKWTVNLGAEQIIPLGDYQITLAADTQYRSGRYVGFEYIAPEYVDHSWATNAQVSIGTKDGRYVLSAFVRNIENNRIVTFASPVPASNLLVALPAAPRTYGLRLSTRF